MENKVVKVGGALAFAAAAIIWLDQKRRDGSMQPLFETIGKVGQSTKRRFPNRLLVVFGNDPLDPETYDQVRAEVYGLLAGALEQDPERCIKAVIQVYSQRTPPLDEVTRQKVNRKFIAEFRNVISLTDRRALSAVLRRWEGYWLDGKWWLSPDKMVLADHAVQVGLKYLSLTRRSGKVVDLDHFLRVQTLFSRVGFHLRYATYEELLSLLQDLHSYLDDQPYERVG